MWVPGVDSGGNWQTIHSNDQGSPRQGSGTGRSTAANKQWVWDEPVRWSVWFKGNGTTDSGSREFFGAVSSSGHTFYENHDVAWFDESDMAVGFDRINFPGYFASTSYPTYNYVLDDIYIAAGDNAAARVEIGNNAIYTSCTKLAIATIDSWSDSSITATVREGGFSTNNTVYVFVVDSNNDPSSGYEITLGESTSQLTGVSLSGCGLH
ncbi:hypothetical protein DSCW_17960 [Desulfosarcina widdelii]|uniref:Uncharacterized protein n=2 Tax=Desulfosarcina widdelii TaxID=947919 RepID=A0A5K7Z294_9BACT|nr:hypothetical protein DSCW_17960 [Desulfosarcina widdelii]